MARLKTTKKEDKIYITVYTDVETEKKAVKQARKRNISRSAIFDLALKEWLKKEEEAETQ